ncbi:MAG TPA: imidazolonepropionase [Solirubrobacteraceae bacterium]|nr:imidazolonepropionase [Solirubrobacteraceae bacterium]
MSAALSIEGARALLLPPEPGLPYLRHDRAAELRLEPGSIACADATIAALDEDASAAVRFDARGTTVVPGLVDCHTHLPWAGWRAGEYEAKVTGVPYEEIARAGGGIASSARAFAAASDDEVLRQAEGIAREMLTWGTTTFEGKSGYGLSRDAELRALRLAGELRERVAQTTVATALLAHAVPPGFTADTWMSEVESLVGPVSSDTVAESLDIFVESFAFSNAHLARMGELARARGLALRAHVEQLATHRSVPVALDAGARSVDHLSRMHPDDVAPLAASECAAVLLPSAELLNAEPAAPGRALADAGAICVLATDANPGTSPVVALPIVMALGVRAYGWSAREAFAAVTLNAAHVLGRSGTLGSIESGKRADLVILEAGIEDVPYRLGHNPVLAVVVGGELAWVREDARERVRS